MKKRELFVFSGQSNMMGAAVFPPKKPILVADSYEYKHKAKRLGAETGEFVAAGYPCGEFSYTDEAMETAYLSENIDGEGNSTVDSYSRTTYFCPAMGNLKSAETHEEYPFDHFSESTAPAGVSMAPLFAAEWEQRGQKCAYAHIAKGGVSILHYFNDSMIEQYNQRMEEYSKQQGTAFAKIEPKKMWQGASAYFDQKVADFFADAEKRFAEEDLSVKAFVWCQGESDAAKSREQYGICLEILWEHLRAIGFTHFFCVRIGFWGTAPKKIHEIMQAQEDFCRDHEACYMITRAMSWMAHPSADGTEWFAVEPREEYCECRDSYFGFKNHHINEKGFALVARRMADNLIRVLREEKEPLLEEEPVSKLIKHI